MAISCDPVNTEPPVFLEQNKTVLVYIAGNNNLTRYAETNLKGIVNGYVPDNDNLLVYFHTNNCNPSLLKVYKNKKGEVSVDTVYKFPVWNSATTEAVVGAMKVTKTMFPAKEYGLFLWSHGTGWLPSGYFSEGRMPKDDEENGGSENKVRSLSGRGNVRVTSNANEIWNTSTPWKEYPNGVDPAAHLVKSFGSEGDKEMEITDLAKSLPYKLSFLVFDACLMGDIEVAYELKDSVDYVVCSPAEILANGFPYQNIMQHVYKTPTDLVGVAKEYYEFYKNSSNPSATISVVKTSELVGVALEAKVIFNKYRSKIGQLDVSNIQRYFRYNKHWFYDVGDFITQLSSPAEAAPFIKSLNNAVIYKAATPDFLYDYGGFTIDPNKYSGLGIYIPTEPSDPELNEFYKKFKWNMDANLIQ